MPGKWVHIGFCNSREQADGWKQTLRLHDIDSTVREEHDMGVICHVWVDGKRNADKAREILGLPED